MIILFSIACPAALLAASVTRSNAPSVSVSATTNNAPPVAATNTPANTGMQYKPIQHLKVQPTPLSTKTQQLDMQNANIQRAKSQAADRHNRAQDAAAASMTRGVVGGAAKSNFGSARMLNPQPLPPKASTLATPAPSTSAMDRLGGGSSASIGVATKGAQRSMGETRSMQHQRLQQYLNPYNKQIETISNIQRKQSETSGRMIQNMR